MLDVRISKEILSSFKIVHLFVTDWSPNWNVAQSVSYISRGYVHLTFGSLTDL